MSHRVYALNSFVLPIQRWMSILALIFKFLKYIVTVFFLLNILLYITHFKDSIAHATCSSKGIWRLMSAISFSES